MDKKKRFINPMEEFLKIKWPTEMPHIEFLDESPDSYVDNLLNNCLESPFTSSESEEEYEDESQKNVDSWYCNQSILNKINTFPKSELNSKEHQLYSSFLLDRSKSEDKIFQNLSHTVLQEQNKFQEFAQKKNYKKFFTIPSEIKGYINNAYKHRYLRVKAYPQFYTPLNKVIPLIYGEGKPFVKIEMIKYLYHMGKVPYVMIPNIKYQCLIPKVRNIAEKKFPSECDDILKNNNILYKTPVSQDKNAGLLAFQNEADIVISSSALNTLIEGQINTKREWTIPVTVKIMNSPNDNSKRTVIFVDKPWPSHSMSALKQYQWYNKLAVKSLLCHKNHEKSKYFSSPPCSCRTGIDVLKYQDSDSEDNYATNCPCRDRLYSPLKRDNVAYSLWNISTEKNDLIRQRQDGVSPLKILIRNRVDGHIDNIYNSVRTKLETQTEMGCEILNTQEIAQMWTTLFFKPKTNLINVRVDLETNELISINTVQLKDLNFNYKPFIGTLFSVFSQLKCLQEGQYLLGHKDGTFCELFKAAKESNGQDKHKVYENIPSHLNFPDSGFIPWTRIDPHLFTNYHLNYNRIPATFPPEKPKSKLFQTKKGKKNKKKKKKKSNKKRKISD